MAEDELKLRRQAERAAHAKALVEDPAVKDAFTLIEADIFRTWLNTRPGDTVLRERCHVTMSVLTSLRDNLAQMIQDGKVAQAVLNQNASKGKAA